MSCKFHPTTKAVTTCAVCGAEMCSSCDAGAFFRAEDDNPICLECSLKEAEEDLTDDKLYQKDLWISGIISSVVWFVGLFLSSVIEGYAFLIILLAGIIFHGKTLFMSEERGFFEKIKAIFWQIILGSLFLPFWVIFLLIGNKIRMTKSNSKVKKIKTALGNTN